MQEEQGGKYLRFLGWESINIGNSSKMKGSGGRCGFSVDV